MERADNDSNLMRPRAAVVLDLARAREQVALLEAELARVNLAQSRAQPQSSPVPALPLSAREYRRYGRQMILSAVGLPGQLALKHAKVLVVGAGGLGCPVLLYLAASGVGDLTILDHDDVELSNLHRQVLHTEARVGHNKAQSALAALTALNSDIAIHALPVAFTPFLFQSNPPPELAHPTFSLILDCTDNPATRHFLNAYASAHRIPLVSGGAVRAEGTVGVYGLDLSPGSTPAPSDLATPPATTPATPDRGPCYACIFPPVPPPNIPLSDEQVALQGTGACSDEGVLGVLCGIVGLSMCAEAVRVLLGTAKPTLHLFSPLSATPFRTIKLRQRQPSCPTCASPRDRWEQFMLKKEWSGWEDPLCELPGIGDRASEDDDTRISARELSALRVGTQVQLVDVRSKAEFGICHVPGSINVPLPAFLRDPKAALVALPPSGSTSESIYFVCRRGNDSLLAARALRRVLLADGDEHELKVNQVRDVKGGLLAWTADVDVSFPVY